jgi:3alpha(or 20beta)-hydroxysteroid dehydrogenase
MGRLDGDIALVTGGAGGMGASHVLRLAQEGARVVFGDIADDLGATLERQLVAQGLDATYFHLDVRRGEDWSNAVESAESRYGGLTILVNNAGILGRRGGFMETDDFDEVIGVNQTGAFLGMRAAVPAFLRAGKGSIVNIASVAAHIPAGPVPYCASKAAVRMMTLCVAHEFGPAGIRANVISPGIIETPMTTDGDHPALEDALLERIPLRRSGEPVDVSGAVVFLCSSEASYISGAEIVVDGGRVMQMLWK